jgi:hypothetical protein
MNAQTCAFCRALPHHTASQKYYVDISIKGLFEASTDKQPREWTRHGSLLHFKSFYSSSSKVIGKKQFLFSWLCLSSSHNIFPTNKQERWVDCHNNYKTQNHVEVATAQDQPKSKNNAAKLGQKMSSAREYSLQTNFCAPNPPIKWMGRP